MSRIIPRNGDPVERILAKLNGVKPNGKGWSARCPAHGDRRPSLSISHGSDGAVLLKCHAGCDTSAVLDALGMTMADLFPPKSGPAPKRKIKPTPGGRTFATADEAIAELERQHGTRSAIWTYHNAQGEPVGVVVRWDGRGGKDIRPVARYADGWRIGAMPDPRPLYNLPRLAAARRVVVCEGEKASDVASVLGFVATTSAGGAEAAVKSTWQPLAGKEVWILPDNDSPGRKYAETVASVLAKLTPAPVVRIVELPDLSEGGDVADWRDAHGDAAEPDSMRAEIEALALAVEPWRPADAEDDLAYRPFPIDALPEPIRGFVDAGARAIGCDPSYLALPLLTACAAAIGNTRRLKLKHGWLAPPILWGAIVGESGTAKTPAFRLVMSPVRERQRKALEHYGEAMKQHEADLARWEKDMAAWKRVKGDSEPPEKPDPPLAERLIVSDTTVEALAPLLLANPRGLLLSRDELAGWIGSFDRYSGKGKASADASNWLSMFDAESIIVDRKTGNPRTIYVPLAAVCVVGGIQPGILQRALGSEHRESGLLARLLLAWPPRKAKRWTEAEIDPKTEAEVVRLFDKLYEFQSTKGDDDETRPAAVRLNAEAKAAWIAYYNPHGEEQADLTGDLAAAWSKLEQYPARLALVVHCIRQAAGDPNLSKPDFLDVVSMHAGIALARWFKHETRRVYAMLGESDTDRDERRLAEWIARKGGTATPRQVQQGCRWLKEPGAAEAALEELAKAGRGTWREVPTTAKGGRPARAFVLSTPSTVYETPASQAEIEGFVGVDAVDTPENEAPSSNGHGGLFPGRASSGPYSAGY